MKRSDVQTRPGSGRGTVHRKTSPSGGQALPPSTIRSMEPAVHTTGQAPELDGAQGTLHRHQCRNPEKTVAPTRQLTRGWGDTGALKC